MAVVTDFSKVLEEELTCSICNDIFKEPRTLQCFHKFCFNCIRERIVEKCKEDQVPQCSICNEGISIQDGKAADLQRSFYAEALLKLLIAMMNSDFDDKEDLPTCVSCDTPCKLTSFCAQCDGMICDECMRMHKTLRVFKEEHQAIELNCFKNEHLSFYIRSQLRCEEESHERKPLQYFCRTCSKCICQKCAETTHNQHVKVSVEEEAECNQDKQRKTMSQETVSTLKEEYTKVLEGAKKEVERYGKETEKAIRNARDATMRYMEMVREHEMFMIAKLNKLYREQHEKYEADERKIKSVLSFFEEFNLQGQALQDRSVADLMLQSEHEMPQYEQLTKSKLSALAELKKAAGCNASVGYVPDKQVTQHLKDLGKIVESVIDTGAVVTK